MEKIITFSYGLRCILIDNWKKYTVPMTMYNLETLETQKELFGMYALDTLSYKPINNKFDLYAIKAYLESNKS